jgi:superfamily II DNA helicase RecQ
MTDTGFRPAFMLVHHLREYGAPVTVLSATLPPSFVTPLCRHLALPFSTREVRRFVSQPNLHYYQVPISYGHAEGMAEGIVLRVTAKLQQEVLGPEGLGIIYCRSTLMVARLGPFFCDQKVYSNNEHCAENIEKWKEQKGKASRWIVSTTSMIAGMNVENVVAVVFFDIPYSLLNLFQGSGRAGRRPGSVGYSVLLSTEVDEREFLGRTEEQALSAMAYARPSVCLDLTMTKHLNGSGRDCKTLGGAQCSVCGLEQEWVKMLNEVATVEEPLPWQNEELEYSDEDPGKYLGWNTPKETYPLTVLEDPLPSQNEELESLDEDPGKYLGWNTRQETYPLTVSNEDNESSLTSIPDDSGKSSV